MKSCRYRCRIPCKEQAGGRQRVHCQEDFDGVIGEERVRGRSNGGKPLEELVTPEYRLIQDKFHCERDIDYHHGVL